MKIQLDHPRWGKWLQGPDSVIYQLISTCDALISAVEELDARLSNLEAQLDTRLSPGQPREPEAQPPV